MYYLIDGYNLLFFIANAERPLKKEREALIDWLHHAFVNRSLKGTLVFDGSSLQKEGSGLSYKGPLTIVYTLAKETADQYILDRIKTSREPLTVVSNDRFLTASARKETVLTLSLKAFLRLLKDKEPSQESKPTFTGDLEALLKIFEHRKPSLGFVLDEGELGNA